MRQLTPALAGLLLCTAAAAQTAPPAPPVPPRDEPVVVPQVQRRDVNKPRYPSRDIEVAAFAGVYNTQGFGSHGVGGLKLGYHVSEDFFVQAALGQSKVSDELFRQVLPGGIFAGDKQSLQYYNLSLGYNLMPGEVFFGKNTAKASAIYLIAGVGSTRIARQRQQTINFGLGLRLMLSDRFSLQMDMRDHTFPLDLLGKRTQNHNFELSTGASFYF